MQYALQLKKLLSEELCLRKYLVRNYICSFKKTNVFYSVINIIELRNESRVLVLLNQGFLYRGSTVNIQNSFTIYKPGKSVDASISYCFLYQI